jgi:integrase/recombinase XerD
VLAIYKRHAPPVPKSPVNIAAAIAPAGSKAPSKESITRKSLKTRSWERASKLAREIEEGKKHRVTITDATDAFIRDAEARGLRPASIYKYRLLFKQLKTFAEKEGLRYLSECDVEVLRRFRESWINKNYSARKKLEATRTFFRFAHDSGWLTTNPAILIKPPKVEDPPTLPFTREQFARIVKACEDYPNATNKIRLKALALLLRYSGLRITDAVTLERHRIADGIPTLRTEKTGTDVRIPLPPSAVDALSGLRTSGKYFFWTGRGATKSCVGDYQRAFKKLYELAGVENGHAHRWRDTFAVELLLSGMPIEQVSILLGHQSVSVTERHYRPFVKARQEQLEAGVRKTFETDKMAYS